MEKLHAKTQKTQTFFNREEKRRIEKRRVKKKLQHVVVRVKAKRNTAFRIYVSAFALNRRRTKIVYANLYHCCITEKNHLPL